MDLLKIQDLVVEYKTKDGRIKAVEGASLKIDKGEIVGLVGESACGKSTLSRSIVSLLADTGEILGGQILFEGKNLLEMTKKELRSVRGRKIAMIFQDPRTFLNPVSKVKAQISEFMEAHLHLDEKECYTRVIDLLKSVNVAAPERVAEYYPHQLSGGMLQRVIIAGALSCGPDLLIADEPTTALDVTTQAQILQLIRELNEKFQMSLLLITHNIGVAAELCDTIYIMYAGKIAESGDIFDVFKNPGHPYTAALLEATLSIEESRKKLIGIGGTVPDLVDPPPGCRFHPRCPKAMPDCSKLAPPTIEVRNEHLVSCWLYG